MNRLNFRRRILHHVMWLATTTCLTTAAAAGPEYVSPHDPTLQDRFGVATLAVLEHSAENLVVQALAADGEVLGTFDLTLSADEASFRVQTARSDWALEIETTEPVQTLAGDAYSGSVVIRSSTDGVVTNEVLASGTVVGGQAVDLEVTDLSAPLTVVDGESDRTKGKGKKAEADADAATCSVDRFGEGFDPYDREFFTAVITDAALAPYRPTYFRPDLNTTTSVSADAGSDLGGDSTVEYCTTRDHQACAAVCALAVVCGAAGCGGGVGCFGCILAAYQCGYCLGKIAQGCPIEMY